jgi:ribosomal protein S18 acetylase RimI-like enzyme
LGEILLISIDELNNGLQKFPWADSFLNSKILIAYKDNKKIVGLCGIKGKFNYLTIYVMDDYRRMGIGKSLLDGAITVAKTMRIDFITLIVSSNNVASQCLFQDFGFRKIKKYPRFFQQNKRNIDYIIMSLHFSSNFSLTYNFFLIILASLPKKFVDRTINIKMKLLNKIQSYP